MYQPFYDTGLLQSPDTSTPMNARWGNWVEQGIVGVQAAAAQKVAAALNLHDYTGDPDGVTDNTAAIDACFTDAEAQDRAIYVRGFGSAKPYVYGGNGSRLTKPVLIGDGFRKSWFALTGLSSLITNPVDGGGGLLGISSLYVGGISARGGFGMIRLDYTGTQAATTAKYIVDNCFGQAYCGAWISQRSPVTGYWKVDGRVQGPVGHAWAMVLGGQADASEINIIMNSVKRGIKFGSDIGTYAPPSDDNHSQAHNSAGARISGMFSTNDGTETGRIAAWFVPDNLVANPTTKGQGGGVFSHFRFSGENYDPSDKRILVADQNNASGLLWAGADTVFRVSVNDGVTTQQTGNLTASTLTAAALQTAIRGLSNVGGVLANVATSSPTGGPWHVWLDDTLRTATITVQTISGTTAQWISDERTREPLLTIPSTGLMSSPIVTDDACFIGGSGAFPAGSLLYSTCGNIDFNLRGRLSSTKPQYVVYFNPESVARSAGLTNALGIVGPFSTDKLTNDKASATACNVMGAVTVVDPQQLFAHRPETVLPGTATGVGLTDLITNATRALTASGAACVLTVDQADGLGGVDAVQAVLSADSGNAYLNIAAGSLKQDVPLWIEFDLAPATGTPATEMLLKITDAADDTVVLWSRFVPVPSSGWSTFVFEPALSVIPAAGIHIGFRRVPGIGVTVGALIGRTRVYHARRPKGRLGMITVPLKTGTYTAHANEIVRCDATGGAFTVTLPTAPEPGSRVTVKKLDTDITKPITIACGGTDVINQSGGSTSVAVAWEKQAVTLEYSIAAVGVWTIVSSDAGNAPLIGASLGADVVISTTGSWVDLFTSQTLPVGRYQVTFGTSIQSSATVGAIDFQVIAGSATIAITGKGSCTIRPVASQVGDASFSCVINVTAAGTVKFQYYSTQAHTIKYRGGTAGVPPNATGYAIAPMR